jgi:hypothetical protein
MLVFPATPAEASTPVRYYRVMVSTSDVDSAGTNARVYLTLFGTNGSSGEVRLDNPGHNDFERGQWDTFYLSGPRLGSITSARIRHDNSGSEPGWYLQGLYATDECSGTDYVFRSGLWLALNVAPNSIDYTLYP